MPRLSDHSKSKYYKQIIYHLFFYGINQPFPFVSDVYIFLQSMLKVNKFITYMHR